jgi:hypothetical protein
MARQEMFVDLVKLKMVIDQLEAEQVARGAPANRPFKSRNELCKAVAATDWGQAVGLTHVVVALRIDRYSIECKTEVRSRGVAVAVAPVATPMVVPGVEPDDMTSSVAAVGSAPAPRKALYRGIDLEAFVAPFLERGLEVTALSSIMTSSLHNKNTNLKIQAAWHDLRERFLIPRVGEKLEDVSSILPLDQVKLPGDLPVDELVPATGDELGLNPEPVGAVGAGWPEGDYDEPQPGEDPFYDPATDEEHIDRLQERMDEMHQEGDAYKPGLTYPYEEDRHSILDPQDVNQELEEWLSTGEAPLDEHPELHPDSPLPEVSPAEYEGEFFGEFPGTEETPPGEFQGEFTATGTTPQGEIVGEFHGEFQTKEEAPQDEYLPMDIEEIPTEYSYDAETHDSSMFEIEETDPNETR